jgi:hypothetical protein
MVIDGDENSASLTTDTLNQNSLNPVLISI